MAFEEREREKSQRSEESEEGGEQRWGLEMTHLSSL